MKVTCTSTSTSIVGLLTKPINLIYIYSGGGDKVLGTCVWGPDLGLFLSNNWRVIQMVKIPHV